MNSKMHFKSALQHALQRRSRCRFSALCLVNGRSDDLADLVIHEYDRHCFVQTTSLERDKQIPEIIEILSTTRKPKSIWLKNQNDSRQKRQLPLSDHLLSGMDPRTINIQEDLFSYNYPTDSQALWPLETRFLRKNLSQWQRHNPEQKFLEVAPKTDFGLSTVFGNGTAVPLQAPHWAEICEALRKIPPDNLYPLGILTLPPLLANDKNKKALFHVLHHFLKSLDQAADVWLSLFASDTWVLGLLQKAAASQKKNLMMLQQHCGEEDLPTPLIAKNKSLPLLCKMRMS